MYDVNTKNYLGDNNTFLSMIKFKATFRTASSLHIHAEK